MTLEEMLINLGETEKYIKHSENMPLKRVRDWI